MFVAKFRHFVFVQTMHCGLVPGNRYLINGVTYEAVAFNERKDERNNVFTAPMNHYTNIVIFYVNGKKVELINPDPRMTLNDYLRSTAGLTGTKLTCGEGGCGSCSVMLTHYDIYTEKMVSTLINSCYRLVPTLDGTSITTSEGIGNSTDGFHPIQLHLAAANGSQCGFCSPGMVMNFYTLLENKSAPTSQEIEDHLDGNMCRCTGYRPILEAFKSYGASDFDEKKSFCRKPTKQELMDIEDLCKTKTSKQPKIVKNQDNNKRIVKKKYSKESETENVNTNSSNKKANEFEIKEFLMNRKLNEKPLMLNDKISNYIWYRPVNLNSLYSLMNHYQSYDCKLVVGNTSQIVYKTEDPKIYFDISMIPELNSKTQTSDSIIIGSSLSITHLIEELNNKSSIDSTLKVMADHLLKMANTQVRNVASWGGNVVLANLKQSSVSDILLVMMNKNVNFVIGNAKTQQQTIITIDEFLTMNFNLYVLISAIIPTTNNNENMETFRSSLRHVNSAPIVSSSFRMKISSNVIQSCSIIYCGIESLPTSAKNTSNLLKGKNVTSKSIFNEALQSLLNELSSSKSYNQSEITAMFYKYYLSLQPNLPSNLISASEQYIRPVSYGSLSYDNEPIEYPVSRFIPKLLSPLQASGEIIYTADIASRILYHGVFVLSTYAIADIVSIDVSDALIMPGVKAWVDSSDIPGFNNCEVFPDVPIIEPLFAESSVFYNGQAIGLIVADSILHARDAAKKVQIEYSNTQTPIISVTDAINKNSFYPPGYFTTPEGPYIQGNPSSSIQNAKYQISGSLVTPSQFHYHLEQQSAVAFPDEGGKITIVSSTQWPATIQKQVAILLGIHNNLVKVENKRCGGAYGAKITRGIPTACAAAVAAVKLNHPVSIVLDINTNMELIGKRAEYSGSYSAGYDEFGKISTYEIDLYSNGGYTLDLTVLTLNDGIHASDNCYNFTNFSASGFACQTNLPTNTAMRAPGYLPSVFYVENMIEQVAYELNMDPRIVRELNFYKEFDVTPFNTPIINYTLPSIWERLLIDSDYQLRKDDVDYFNNNNRWVKKGISITPIKYGIPLGNRKFHGLVNICSDGTVQITHNGVEIGQGIDTKCVQVASLILQCPIQFITVTPTDTQKTPNGAPTGSSVTSSLCALAIENACLEINSRLATLRSELPPDIPFNILGTIAVSKGINCSASSFVNHPTPNDGNPFTYCTYGAAVSEIQLDVLTGDVQILRADVLYDCGRSLNPAIDIGQVEGCFVTGIGYLLTEKLTYDDNGSLVTNGTYTYKPPSQKDIPIDFRVSLLKDSNNPEGVILGSKTAGEPPLILSLSVYWAVRHAIFSAAKDANGGQNVPWFNLSPPLTIDVIQQACNVDYTQFTI